MSELSESWEVGNFGSYFKPKYGKALPKEERSDCGRYPVVGSAGVMAHTDAVLSAGPTIVIGRKGNVGQVKYFQEGCYPIDTTYYIQVTDGWDLKFLELLLHSLELKRLDRSTATPSLRREDLEAVSLVRPPLDEQKCIVEILEEQLSLLDAAQKGLAEVRRKAELFKASAITEKFHLAFPLQSFDAANPESNTRTVLLNEVADVINGDRGKNYPSKAMRTSEGIPFINAGHIGDGVIDQSEMDYISKEHFAKLSNGKIKQGDLLFCIRGSLGKVALNDELKYGAIASSLVIIRPKPEVRTKWLLYYLMSGACKEMIRRYDNGTAQPNLAAANLKKFEVFVPSLALQDSLLNSLADELGAHVQILQSLDIAEKRANELRRSLLHAAFTGQLTKEPANV